MDTTAVRPHPVTQRLLLALARLGEHDPALPVAAEDPDAITRLARVRFQHLAAVEKELAAQRLPELRIDKLLGFHQVALMWLTDLAGRQIEPCDMPEGTDRAVMDTTVALLLWHSVRNFHATQRLVQFCLRDLDPALQQPRRAS